MQVALTGTLSAAERSCPTSGVRGRSREDPMPEGRRPRGVTPRLRSGAVAESARLRRHRNSQEELPCIQGQGRRLGGATLGLMSGAVTGRSHSMSEVRGSGQEEPPRVQGQGRQPGGATPGTRPGAVARKSNPTPGAKGGGQEEQPHIRGAVAARAQGA